MHDRIHRRLSTLQLLLLRVRLCLDLAEQTAAVIRDLGQVSDPQAVRQIMVQGEVVIVLPQLFDPAQFVRQTLFAIHRAGWKVPGKCQDHAAVVGEAAPSKTVTDRPQLSSQPLMDIGFEFPTRELNRVAVMGRCRRIRRQRGASPQALDDARALCPTLLNPVHETE